MRLLEVQDVLELSKSLGPICASCRLGAKSLQVVAFHVPKIEVPSNWHPLGTRIAEVGEFLLESAKQVLQQRSHRPR